MARKKKTVPEVKDEIQTVFDNPEEFEPLTDDRAVWTGFRAQRAAARAMANDGEAEHLSLEQCLELAVLVRKNNQVPGLAMVMQLKLSGMPCELPEHCVLFLAGIFRGSFLIAEALVNVEIAAMAEPAKDPGPPNIPEDERSMTLVDEPFALTETARRMQKQG